MGRIGAFCDLSNQQLLESLRELASLDGAIIVDRRGVVESAGVYLDAPLTKAVKVDSGLGARHTAAAAISEEESWPSRSVSKAIISAMPGPGPRPNSGPGRLWSGRGGPFWKSGRARFGSPGLVSSSLRCQSICS